MKDYIPKFKQILLNSEIEDFETLAIEAFRFQSKNCSVYREFISHLGINANEVQKVSQIPFLPISLYKSRDIIVHGLEPETVFLSSGTAGVERSRKLVPDLDFYHQISQKGFEYFFGPLKNFQFIFFLPGYGKANESSLINMADHFLNSSIRGGFIEYQTQLEDHLSNELQTSNSILLFGVTHALLQLEKFPGSENLKVIETGGMKGRGKEILRAEVHQRIKECLGVSEVLSEYGMAELMSQSYSLGKGIFQTPPWKKVMVRDIWSSTEYLQTGRTGLINIIDLANIETCSFISTEDLGKAYEDGSFEILGRLDQSDLRGCNLLSN